MASNSIKNTVYTFRNINSKSPIPPAPRPVNNKILQESGVLAFILLENSSNSEFIIQE